VFTTRDREIARHLSLQNIVEVPAIDPDIGQRTLQKLLISRCLINEQQEADLLLKEFMYFLLAIKLAAAFMKANDMALKEYLPLLEKYGDQAISLLGEEFEDEWRSQGGRHP
jgi:hypothetical protein